MSNYIPAIRSTSSPILPEHHHPALATDFIDNAYGPVYFTGSSIFRSIGLTDKSSDCIELGAGKVCRFPVRKTKTYSVRCVPQRNVIAPYTIYHLQILDCLRYNHKIQNSTSERIFNVFLQLLSEMDSPQRKELVLLAKKYPPYVRAVTGAILNYLGDQRQSAFLRLSLDPRRWYQLKVFSAFLPNAKLWNII